MFPTNPRHTRFIKFLRERRNQSGTPPSSRAQKA